MVLPVVRPTTPFSDHTPRSILQLSLSYSRPISDNPCVLTYSPFRNMRTLNEVASSNLSLPPDTYIYSVLPIGLPSTSPTQLAALCSDDSLRLISPDLSLSTLKTHANVNASVTCANRFSDDGNLIATAGRDGLVRVLDARSGSVVAEARMRKYLKTVQVLIADR